MTVVQFNDPDPIFWSVFYGLSSLIPALAMFNRSSPLLNWLCVALAAYALSSTIMGGLEYLRHATEESLVQDMQDDKPYIEEAREFIGALIALTIVLGYLIVSQRKQNK